jgi:hypothetical protein
MTQKELGLIIEVAIVKSGLKKKNIALKMGINYNTITKWCQGKTAPDIFEMSGPYQLTKGKALIDWISEEGIDRQKPFGKPLRATTVHQAHALSR